MSTIKQFYKWLLIPIFILGLNGNAFAAFSDVETGDTHYVAITTLEEGGIIDGYEDNTFRAWQEINRAEALKMLTLASGLFTEEGFDGMEITDPPFKDTAIHDWYIKYLVAAKDAEVIHGYEDDTFKPEKTVKLAEALKIFLESFENLAYPLTEEWLFADTPIESWFTKYTAYAGSRGMLDIWPSNSIYPDQDMTRGYLAEIIYRKLKFKEGYRFGKATYYGAAVQGNGTASGETFNMYDLTAAHKTLPFGTIVEVTNLANGKNVRVRITDRGPYGPGRVIDLTTTAFSEIASTSQGVIHVQYKVVTE